MFTDESSESIKTKVSLHHVQWRTEGGWGVQLPPEIPKALQNRAKLNLKLPNLGRQHPKVFEKKSSKILNLPRFAIVLH